MQLWALGFSPLSVHACPQDDCRMRLTPDPCIAAAARRRKRKLVLALTTRVLPPRAALPTSIHAPSPPLQTSPLTAGRSRAAGGGPLPSLPSSLQPLAPPPSSVSQVPAGALAYATRVPCTCSPTSQNLGNRGSHSKCMCAIQKSLSWHLPCFSACSLEWACTVETRCGSWIYKFAKMDSSFLSILISLKCNSFHSYFTWLCYANFLLILVCFLDSCCA